MRSLRIALAVVVVVVAAAVGAVVVKQAQARPVTPPIEPATVCSAGQLKDCYSGNPSTSNPCCPGKGNGVRPMDAGY